jgi:hypothetical protein
MQGKGGYGTGASKNSKTAILKALRFAILGAINIPLYRRHTVYFPTKTKYVTTKISIFPRPTDFGISASPIVTEACELLGIKNITVKVRSAVVKLLCASFPVSRTSTVSQSSCKSPACEDSVPTALASVHRPSSLKRASCLAFRAPLSR